MKIASCTNLNEPFSRNTQTFLDTTLTASTSSVISPPVSLSNALEL